MTMDEKQPEGSYPNTFVPGRNLLFLTFAATLAYAQASATWLPASRRPITVVILTAGTLFIRSANATLNLAMDKQFVIHTPLMWRNKKGVWQLADELGVFEIIRNETLTCYNGILAEGCGHCPACLLRNKGLESYLTARGSSSSDLQQQPQ